VARSRLLLSLVLVATLAACASRGPVSEATVGPQGTPATGTAAASQGSTAGPTGSIAATRPPSVTPTPTVGSEPSATLVASPTTAGSAPPGIADACTGSEENRQFFVDVARSVDWAVLCAVLPNRWFVDQGSYRLANGGKMEVGYNGPGGATLSLSEGSFCGDADGCVPSGTDVGDAALGPLPGTLVRLDEGGFAVVVDRGQRPSWVLETHQLDQPTTVALAAAVLEVQD
jgi:hypothetical protein